MQGIRSTQNSVMFLYIYNEQSEIKKKLRNTSIYNTIKNYPRVNLTKEMKDVYTKNFLKCC